MTCGTPEWHPRAYCRGEVKMEGGREIRPLYSLTPALRLLNRPTGSVTVAQGDKWHSRMTPASLKPGRRREVSATSPLSAPPLRASRVVWANHLLTPGLLSCLASSMRDGEARGACKGWRLKGLPWTPSLCGSFLLLFLYVWVCREDADVEQTGVYLAFYLVIIHQSITFSCVLNLILVFIELVVYFPL